MKEYFPQDTYETPVETKRFLLDALLFRSRWALYLKFSRIVFASKKKALDGDYDDSAWAESSYQTMKLVEGCGGRFSISGLDYVRNLKKPVVFIGNHMSTLETLILPVLIAPLLRVTYVVKDKLVQGRTFGPVMRSRKPITVTRTDPRKDLTSVLEGGKKLLADGCSIIIFPQSTRREVFRRRQFNSLGVKLALHANVDIVPVALKTDFWTNGRFLKGFGPIVRNRTIHIAFGAPKTTQGKGKKEHQYVVDFVEEHLRSWGADVESLAD